MLKKSKNQSLMLKLLVLISQVKLNKECLTKELLKWLFLKVWRKVQNESKLKSEEDLTELKLLEKKHLEKVMYLLKQLDQTLTIVQLELKQFTVH